MPRKRSNVTDIQDYFETLKTPVLAWGGSEWKWFFDNICRRDDDPWGFLADFVRTLVISSLED